MMSRVKICCIQSIEEAALAVRYGASAVGLVSAMPSGPGPIPEASIQRIARCVPPGVSTFLLTCLTDADAIIAQQQRCGTSTLQLVDRVDPALYIRLRRALPGISLVQVIHVRDSGAIDEARLAAQHVDALLLDSGNPDLPIKELGGTGRTHDWSISRRIRESVTIPVFLAGGLNAANVSQAIREVQPFAVDVCSGVRDKGQLSESKLSQFMSAVRSCQSPVGAG